MPTLLVLRHAEAARAPGQPDHERPLTDGGRREARAMGRWIADQGLAPDHALLSDAARAVETVAAAGEAFSEPPRDNRDPALYLADAEMVLAALRGAPEADRLLLCGHNPSLQDFAAALAGSGPALDRLRAGLPTAGLAVLELDAPWRDVRWGAGRLVAFVTPADVEARA